MTALTCDHCEKAKAGIGTGYRLAPNPCVQCVARSVSRSLVTFEAVRTRDATELRETLARLLPALSYEQANAMVKAWWQRDREHRNSNQACAIARP